MQWLQHYDQGVPETLGPYPERTLLGEAVAQRPGAPALLFKGRTVSHGELDRLSDAFAAALVRLGVAKGDRMALLLPNWPPVPDLRAGRLEGGAVVHPLNPIYTEHELQGAPGRTGAETIVVLTPFYGRVKSVQPRTALTRVVATNLKEYLRPLLRVLFTLAKERKDGHRVRLHEGDLWLAALLDTIEKTRRTAFSGVPTLFNALINHPRVRAGKVDLSSIKVCSRGRRRCWPATGTTPRRRPPRSGPPTASAGCTPATSATWMATATCSSSTA